MMFRQGLCWLAGCATLLAHPAAAEDQPQSAAVAAANARAAEANARAAEIDAQAKLMKSRFDALGVNPAKGETTLSEGAGTMEAWMLGAATMSAAAKKINDAVKVIGGAGPKVLLGSDDHFDPAYAVVFEQQLTAVKSGLGSAWATAGCDNLPAETEKFGPAIASAALAGAGAVLGLFRTDTELRGIAVDAKDRALINAIAAQAPNVWIVPGEVVALAEGDPLLASVKEMATARQRLFTCKLGKAKDKNAVATIDAAVTKADGWFDDILTPGVDSQTPLARAAASAQLANAAVLRVSIEKAGGSLLKRANVWTALGAPAVGLTGGLVVSYRLFTPADGKVVKAGLLVCRTSLTSMNAVQANRVKPDANSCSDGL